MFIALGGGILTIAASTDAYILQLGGSGDTEYFIPYRNGVKGYKYFCVEGECKLKCISDPKYTVHYLGLFGNKTLKGDDRLGFCIKYYPEYKCHPTPEVVAAEVLRVLSLP
jgi:hypothetical protein